MYEPRIYHWTAKQALEGMPGVFRQLFQHGSMVLEFYAPRNVDEQQPHSRDELYAVVSGTGWFVNGEIRHQFGPGDILFAPAGAIHRFEDFSDDLQTWVIFYGPEGGEANLQIG